MNATDVSPPAFQVDYHMDVMDGFIDGNADEAPDG